MKVCKMNEKYKNVCTSIRSLVNEYLKMNGTVSKPKFGVCSPGLTNSLYLLPFSL